MSREIGKAHSPEVQAMMHRIKAAWLLNGSGDSEDVATLAKHVLNLTAERDALKADNDTLQWMRFGLARELLEALSILRDWDDSEDLERKTRMQELRDLLETQP